MCSNVLSIKNISFFEVTKWVEHLKNMMLGIIYLLLGLFVTGVFLGSDYVSFSILKTIKI